MSTAIDVSHWAGAFARSKLAAAQAAGATKLIVGTQRQDIATAQIDHAKALGMEVEAYVYIYFASNPAERVRRDLTWLRAAGVSRLWIDAEDTVPGFTQDEYVAGIRGAVEAAGSACAGIYTGGWWWKPRTGDSDAFKHLPLWAAQYDGIADLSRVTLFGSWSSMAMKQYRPHTSYGDAADGVWFPSQPTGVWCDVNVYEPAVRPTLTAEQREVLEWLETPAGHAIGPQNRTDALASVGLPATAQLADYARGVPAPPPTPMPAPQPTEPAIDRAAVRRHLDSIDAEIAAVRRLVGPA